MKSVITNVHIPKTAGSNYRRQMHQILPRIQGGAQIVGVDGGANSGEIYYQHLRELAKPAFARLKTSYVQFVSGHFRYRDVADFIEPLREDMILTTALRDPVERFVSDYVYSISDRHKAQDEFIAKYQSFEDYLKDPIQLNKQLDYLRPTKDASVEETLETVVEAFDFVAITERFDDDFELLCKRLGYSPPQATRHNEGKNKALARELHEAYHDQLAELLAPEQMLYDGMTSVDWGTEPFEMVNAPDDLLAGPKKQLTDTVSNEWLRAEIKAMRPWHHNIALNADVATDVKGADNPMGNNVSLTLPANVFSSRTQLLLPNGMQGKTFLDCGCNAGGYCFAAKDAGATRTFGFDVRQHWIDQARFIAKHRERNSNDMTFEVAELLGLEAIDEKFDVTWFSGLLYHLPCPVQGLKAAADKTRDLIFVDTAVQPLSGTEEEKQELVLKFEGTEHLMSGVHRLSWLPGGPKVLRQLFAWMGFPETRLLNWRTHRSSAGTKRPDRLSIVAAREYGRLDAVDDIEMGGPANQPT